MVAKPSGHGDLMQKMIIIHHLVAIPSLALAAALALATSTPLTEASRKTQRALYITSTLSFILLHLVCKKMTL